MASFGVNPVSPEASKSWLLRKTCPSWAGSKSTSHNHCDEVLAGLVRDGLASKRPESVSTSGRSVAVARFKITDAGQRALVQ
jgi:hypothetical protein